MADVADLWVTLRAETAPFRRGMSEAATTGESFTAKMGGIGGAMTKLGKATTLVGVGVAAVSVKMATDFQSATTRLVTSAGETNDKLDLVRKGLLSMAGQVGVSANDLAKSMYYVEAAGYHAGDGLTVLKAAAQGAAAEGADTTTVAQALTDVLKDYHLQASAAGDITSKMITAVAHGKVNLQDFSSAFASIVPAASAAGISFNDVGAALAEMTNHGFTAQRASQNLAQALRSLLNPTKPMQKAFADFGVSTDTLRAKLHGPNGLTDAMQYLSEAASKAGKEGTPEFASALRRLMGTAPGANAALSTVGANMKDTNDTIKAMGKSTTDAHGKVKGFAEVQETLHQKVAQLKAGFDTLLIQLGTKLIPIITKAIDFFTRHKTITEGLAVAIGVILTGSVLKFIGSALSPFTKGLVGAAKGATNLVRGFRDVEVAASSASGKAGTVGGALRKGFDGAVKAAKTAGDAVKDFSLAVGRVSATAGKTAWTGLVNGIKGVGLAMKGAALQAAGLVRSMAAATLAAARSALAWTAEKLALIGSAIAEKAAALAQWALNIAMDANPIMLIVLALAALVGAIIYAYTHFAWFRNGVKAAWSAIVGAAKSAWDWLQKAFSGIVDGLVSAYHGTVNAGKSLLHWVEALPGRIYSYLSGLASHLYNMAATAWEHFKTATATKAVDLISWVSRLPGRILSGIGNLGSLLWNSGASLIRGFINGIESMAANAVGSVSNLVSKVRNFFPFSPAKEGPFAGRGWTLYSGQALMEGFADGISQRQGHAVSTMRRAAAATAGALTGGLTGGSLGGLALAGGGGGGVVVNNHVHLNVEGHVLTERKLRDLLEREMLRLGMRNPQTYASYSR